MRQERHGARHVFTTAFRGREISAVGRPRRSRGIIRGEIQNISSGGLCLLTSRPIKESCTIRGEIILPGIPVGVPSLMQVRWVEQAAKGSRYKVGLQFLI